MVKIVARRSAPAAVAYFLNDPALGEDEKQGTWMGHIAQMLQLPARAISDEEMHRALAARVPAGPAVGMPMAGNLRPTPRVGWELVFAAPKSVSLAAAGVGKQARKAKDAFLAAVRATFRMVEKLARRQHEARSTESLLGALFVHGLSRRNDPHLHAHVLIAHSTWDPHRQRFYRLEPREIYRHIRDLTAYFQRALVRQLEMAGLRARLVQVGRLLAAQLETVPRAVVARFSRGRREITRLSALVPPPAGMNREAWANYLNDRTRPRKTAPPAAAVPAIVLPSSGVIQRAAFRERAKKATQAATIAKRRQRLRSLNQRTVIRQT